MTRYLLLLLVLTGNVSLAQSFITKVSSTTIGRNDVLQIEYVAEDVDIDQFVLPHFNKWTVVSGPNLSSSRMQTGNSVKEQMVYSVMVQPNATGALPVPGATALINNKPTRSNNLTVQVKNVDHLSGGKLPVSPGPQSSIFDQLPFEDELPSSQYLKKGEKAIDKIKNNILVRLEVNKRSCYVGQPILAVYKLCTRLRSKSKVVKQPTFSGCTVIELTGDDQNQHVEKVNGTDYNVFVIRKVQLVPLEAGQLVLPETSVENKVSFYDASNLSYRDLYYSAPSIPVEEQMVTLQNKPVTVEVKPLPALPIVANTDFSGAVGKFDITAAVNKEGLTTTTTNKLFFTIEGEGNLQQVKPPVIKWPNGIEAFEASEQVDDDKSTFPVKSKKTFTFPFIADKKGNYSIPSIQFTYFDASENRYVTKATHGFILQIAQGNKSFLNIANRSNVLDNFQSRLYILLAGAFVAVVIGLVWFNGKQKVQPQPVTGPAPLPAETKEEIKKPDASDYLFAIRELQPDANSSNFYKSLCRNLQEYLHTKFNLEPGQLPFYIERNPPHANDLQEIKTLLDNCSLGMYTPVFTIEEAMQHRLQAIDVLCRLEKGTV